MVYISFNLLCYLKVVGRSNTANQISYNTEEGYSLPCNLGATGQRAIWAVALLLLISFRLHNKLYSYITR